MPFEKIITNKYIYEPINKYNNQLYSMYRYAQQEDDSRGLIARTLNYNEFLTFALKVNPTTSYDKFFDKIKTIKKILKFCAKIPKIYIAKPYVPENELDKFNQLLLSEEFYNKVYAYYTDLGICFEEMLLFSVYELVKVKNPKYVQYNADYYYYDQHNWLNITEDTPQTEFERTFSKARKIQRRVNYLISEQERLLEIYGELNIKDHQQIIKDLEEVNVHINKLKQDLIE